MMNQIRPAFIAGLLMAAATQALSPSGAWAQQQASPGAAASTTASDDLNSTITLNLNNVQFNRLVQFLSETTGKPVIAQRGIDVQITVVSPIPVTKRRALDLIYAALKLEDIYVVDFDNRIQIVQSDAIRGLPIQTIDDDDDLQSFPDSTRLGQRIYRLKNVNAEDLRKHLEGIVPESAMTLDSKTNTLILTDQISRLKQFDRVVQALESMDIADREIEIFKLKHADAMELALLLGNILIQASIDQSDPRGSSNAVLAAMRMADMARSNTSRGSNRDRGSSSPIIAGDVTLVADPRMNWLIVSSPRSQLAEITRLIDEFDREEDIDVKVRYIAIEHVEASSVGSVVSQLYRESSGTSAKDVIRTVADPDSNSLYVLASQTNFDRIQELVRTMDTESAEKRETRSYVIQFLEAQDLADQLTELFDQSSSSSYQDGPFLFISSFRSTQSTIKPTFVPSPRTNTLLALARPRDFEFIEKMIDELDVAIDADAFEPHIYRIHHTDANEMVNILETLFEGDPVGARSNDIFWRPTGGNQQNTLDAMFGEIRFVVDNVTNTIVALASNPKNYEIIDRLVEQLDQVDPESTEVLVYELKHADALDVADHLNNLFSDGSVQRTTQGGGGDDEDGGTAIQVASAASGIVFPWQSSQGSSARGEDDERPINTMVGNVRVVPDVRSNQILIAAPPIYFDALRTVIAALDTDEPQVYISTRIVEIVRGDERRVGIRWTPDPQSIDPAELDNAILAIMRLGLLDSFGGSGDEFRDTSVRSVTSPNNNINPVTRTVESSVAGGNSIIDADVNIGLLLQLLIKNTDARIVSKPGIAVHNNETGSIFIGSEFPFRTSSQTTDVGALNIGIEYRPVGISLDVTPHINAEGEVILAIRLESSSIREGQLIDGAIIKDTREFETELAVDSGQTMVIGGILLEEESETRRATPILGKIPVVKWFFSKRDTVKTVRELVVFITPEVLRSRADDDDLLERAEDRLAELEEVADAGR